MSARKKSSTWLRRVGFVAYSLVVACVVLEVLARVATTETAGRAYLRGLPLLPIPRVSDAQQRVLDTPRDAAPYVVPDPLLGWRVRPGGHHPSLPYAANDLGLRSAPSEVEPWVGLDVHRVLVVGDSFAHGSEVPWKDTWTQRLDEDLGPRHEVWNGGVPGYGTDQALLRMRQLLPAVDPDVVILTVIVPNLWRNVNILRAVVQPTTSFPWSKPRFVLDGDGLRLVNRPAIPPSAISDLFHDFEKSHLVQYESLWQPEIYADDWRHGSRLLRYLLSRRTLARRHDARMDIIGEGGEAIEVTARIAELFTREVRDIGAEPMVVLMPVEEELPRYGPGGRPLMATFSAALEKRAIPFVDVGSALYDELEEGEDAGALFASHDNGHPNARASKIIARTLASRVRELTTTNVASLRAPELSGLDDPSLPTPR